MVKLITGSTGGAHVTSADDGDLFKNLTYKGDYVFIQDIPIVQDEQGDIISDNLTVTVDGALAVSVIGGAFLMCSRFVRNVSATSLTLPAGVVGEEVDRYICLKYTLDNNIESVEMTLETDITNTTTIYEGATTYIMPLFLAHYVDNKVTVTGIFKTLMAANARTTDEGDIELLLPESYAGKKITFKNPADAIHPCDVSIYGGNAESDTAICVYDNKLNKSVWQYTGGKFCDGNSNLLERNVITVGLTADCKLTNNEKVTMLCGKIFEQVGDRLSVISTGVKIGAGVKKVLVSGYVYYYTGTYNAGKNLQITRRTGSTYISVTNLNFRPSSQFLHYATAPRVLSVTQGDIIEMRITGAANDIIKAYGDGTYLTVEVVG